jgi:glycosyltransferase involved in cell wall biosynthesis
VANAMQKLYEDKELYNELSQKNIDKFSAPEFSWKESAKLWDKLFTEVKNGNNIPE